MYRIEKTQQLTFDDFNQSCGMQLDTKNDWIILADHLDWKIAEDEYSQNFTGYNGRVATPVRQVLGALLIQKRMGLSDRGLVKAISENPYYQYFIGLTKFSSVCPFKANSLVAFRKRLNIELLIKFNEKFLESAPVTAEHSKKSQKQTTNNDNQGTVILDATCSPSNIRYPQDFSLLNEAREKTDSMIDILHKQVTEPKRPRTYRRVLRSEYLNMAKSKKRSAKKVRALIFKLLHAVRRNIAFIDEYLKNGGVLSEKLIQQLETIRELYRQQKQMYDEKTHRIENRIVSINQPYIRPIVRGKSKTPVEFGVKYDISIDEKGHGRIEKISFDGYNECTILENVIQNYKERTGHYPARILVDKIYRTKENRDFCKKLGVEMSGRGAGRPPSDKTLKKQERKNDIDRIEVERFFSVEKRCYGAGLIMTKLECTTLSSIMLSVLAANIFGLLQVGIFYFCIIAVSKDTLIGCFWENSDDLS